jgi:hypothetical protein
MTFTIAAKVMIMLLRQNFLSHTGLENTKNQETYLDNYKRKFNIFLLGITGFWTLPIIQYSIHNRHIKIYGLNIPGAQYNIPKTWEIFVSCLWDLYGYN